MGRTRWGSMDKTRTFAEQIATDLLPKLPNMERDWLSQGVMIGGEMPYFLGLTGTIGYRTIRQQTNFKTGALNHSATLPRHCGEYIMPMR
jgi:hypothetical protein